jgi:tetratricopeptide (TPR) repeat protein
MTANPFDWDDELPPETEEEVYRALLRALRRKQGFGLFFVQCSKDQGTKIVADLRRDLPQPQIQELHLQGEVVTLYDQIAKLWQQQPFDLLVIEGLEASLYAYEDTKRFSGWSSDEIYNYSWKGVPKILNHLNQQREHLRNDFPARFIFLVPPFVVDYFIQRAADFLDWRSGLFRFPRPPSEITQDADRFAGGSYTEYLTLAPQARIEKILELKSLQDICPDSEIKTNLLFELGLLFAAEQDYGNAVISWKKAIEIKPDLYQAWGCRGVALSALGRNEEAIASYDQALELKPDKHEAWYGRGLALSALGRKEEAIASYDKAIEFKPDKHEAWYSRGAVLSDSGRKEESIASYDQALELKPDYHEAWYNRGIVLSALGRNEEAIASYDQALEFKPDYDAAWYNRGVALSDLGRKEEAIASYDQALEIKPDKHEAHYNKACCYGLQKQIDLAIATLQQAIVLDSECREWAKTDSDFDGIRSDDRFQALIGE